MTSLSSCLQPEVIMLLHDNDNNGMQWFLWLSCVATGCEPKTWQSWVRIGTWQQMNCSWFAKLIFDTSTEDWVTAHEVKHPKSHKSLVMSPDCWQSVFAWWHITAGNLCKSYNVMSHVQIWCWVTCKFHWWDIFDTKHQTIRQLKTLSPFLEPEQQKNQQQNSTKATQT